MPHLRIVSCSATPGSDNRANMSSRPSSTRRRCGVAATKRSPTACNVRSHTLPQTISVSQGVPEHDPSQAGSEDSSSGIPTLIGFHELTRCRARDGDISPTHPSATTGAHPQRRASPFSQVLRIVRTLWDISPVSPGGERSGRDSAPPSRAERKARIRAWLENVEA
ncbi:hypothetical protein BKA93DRAFT_557941 [Sparassis latifolia]